MQLNHLLASCIKQHASDLHLSANQRPYLRINGDLLPLVETVLDQVTVKMLIYSTMRKEQQQAFEEKLELDYSIDIPDLAAFRINAFHQKGGIAAAFRVIPNHIPTLEELGMPAIFKKLLAVSNGIILLTGSTGSGKSTTSAAMIDFINTHLALHIITIEDPIEFVHMSKQSLIHQRQIHTDTHCFASALRSALREDPNVIFLGEMRDSKTIRLALTAAETGHLILATLHASSAPRSIHRIVDAFPTNEKNRVRNMLSESLQAVICQTLVKDVNHKRVVALEIMLGTPAIRHLIREDKIGQMYSTMQTSGALGMRTLDQSLQLLLETQRITETVAREAMSNKSPF